MNTSTAPLCAADEAPAGLSYLPANDARMQASAIALYAAAGPNFEAKLEASLALLTTAAHEYAGHIVQATSLGAEDMVITDLIVRHKLGIPIGTLETGALHAETVELIPRLQARYGITVEIYRPQQTQIVHFVSRHGQDAMYHSIALRKNCCDIRKMEPLSRMLSGRQAWITGLRREQSNNRGAVAASETDANGRTKLNPLADWSWREVWHYIASHQVPYNPLHDRFMPSIGCAPCTRAIAVGEDFRAGRWWWEDETAKECGLHVNPTP